MMHATIFMDECGYTGSDLFNNEQPIFTLATLNCANVQAEEFKRTFFKDVHSKELKHSILAKYRKQQAMVIEFIRYLAREPKLVKISVVDKKYAIVTKMVDIVVEELAHKDGIDLYKRGGNIAYANLLYYVVPCFLGRRFFNRMLFNFQELMRTRNIKAYTKFFKPFFNQNFPEEIKNLLTPFQAFHFRIGPKILSFPPGIFEVSLGCAANLMAQWHEDLKQNMILIHDRASNMAKNKQIWDLFVSPNLPQKRVGYDRRKITFPIGVKTTIFENSKNKAGLQLADVVAGATARWGKYLIHSKASKDRYEKELDKLFPGNFSGRFIWPIPQVTPKDLGTNGSDMESLVNYSAQIIRDYTKLH